MRAVLISILTGGLLISNSIAGITTQASPKEPSKLAAPSSNTAPFDRLRAEGFDAVYNLDYQTARDRFLQMTKTAPEHPAGYVYLANNLWLETLFQNRRLSTSLYTGASFYVQDKDEDQADQKRDREFNDLIRQALAASRARLLKNSKDVEALYYSASALGIRAAYRTSVKRSFMSSIGDGNDAIKIQRQVIKLDPNYVDAYMSIGFYEYVIDSLPGLWRFAARFAGLKGSKKAGIEHLEQVTREGKYTADDARVLLLGIYSKENQPARALEIISYLTKQYPRNYLFGVERASMLYRLGRYDEGSGAFADLLKDQRVASQVTDLVTFQWAESLFAKGDYQAAVERYNQVERWPKAAAELVSLSHLHAGQALDALGKRDEALAEYQVVLKRENVFDSHKLATQYVKKAYAPSKG
ncbi:MAG TPA: tetratricopeptide repeat protein [Blastocatellia bacterium]|nr:tetratricopeptide repeat protein [Blastocatellia bacterium]